MKKTIIAALAVVAMVGCAKDMESGVESQGTLVQFESSPATRVENDMYWETTDQIGIMVVKPADQSLYTGYKYNNCYDVTPDTSHSDRATFSPISGNEIYYSFNAADKIDFYAYYPYISELTETADTYTFDIKDQSTADKQTKFDLMEASTNATSNGGYNKESGAVTLQFNRKMSKISLEFICKGGVEIADITDLKFEGFHTTATYDFQEGDVYDAATANSTALTEDDIIKPLFDENTFSAIVLPEDEGRMDVVGMATKADPVPVSQRKVTFTLKNGEEETEKQLPIPYNCKLEANKHYKIKVVVDNGSIVMSGWSIEDWENATMDDSNTDDDESQLTAEFVTEGTNTGDMDFGVFMGARAGSIHPIMDNCDNVKYVKTADGRIVAANNSEAIMYPDSDGDFWTDWWTEYNVLDNAQVDANKKVLIFAYSPYVESSDANLIKSDDGTYYTYDIDIKDQTKNLDYMYYKTTSFEVAKAKPIPLSFSHILSKVVFIISDIDTEAQINFTDATVSIKRIWTKATLNLKEGTVVEKKGDETVQCVMSDVTATGATATALVIPGGKLEADKITVTIRVDGKSYEVSMPAINFASDTVFTYNIKFSSDYETPQITSSSIAKWTVKNETTLRPTPTETVQ